MEVIRFALVGRSMPHKNLGVHANELKVCYRAGVGRLPVVRNSRLAVQVLLADRLSRVSRILVRNNGLKVMKLLREQAARYLSNVTFFIRD